MSQNVIVMLHSVVLLVLLEGEYLMVFFGFPGTRQERGGSLKGIIGFDLRAVPDFWPPTEHQGPSFWVPGVSVFRAGRTRTLPRCWHAAAAATRACSRS